MDHVRLRALLDEPADEIGPPDEDVVDEGLDGLRSIAAASRKSVRRSRTVTLSGRGQPGQRGPGCDTIDAATTRAPHRAR